MSDDELTALGAADLLAAYRARATDPVAVVTASLAALDGRGRAHNAVLALADPERARADAVESARRWAAGEARPLEGVPVGVKDIVATADLPTTGGARVLGDAVPRADATCVARLRAAGAIVVAKLATSEFAAGQPDNATFGPVRNPWDTDRWTGGSSTGSGGALAARCVPLAIGTDTGGSIRIPSAWCGTTGLKPTYGRVPRTGVLPLSWTLDHVGPMARSALDCGLMLASMAGADGRDPHASSRPVDPALTAPPTDLAGRRIGAVRGWFTDVCDGQVHAAWLGTLDALADAGATIVDVDLPAAHHAFAIGWEILYAEAASLHEGHLDRLDELDRGFAARMLQGRALLAVDYLRALRVRSLLLDEALHALERVDVLCTIGAPGVAPRLDDLLVDVDGVGHPMLGVHSRATMYGNVTGLPALMLPSGFDRRGLPLAVQLLGRPFDEALLVGIGHALQSRTDHHRVVPPLATVPPSPARSTP